LNSRVGATDASFLVLDESGAPAKDILVIVRSLEKPGEIFRALSSDDGKVPKRDLSPGLHRMIATMPYGYWKTGVVEFVVGDKPLQVTTTVEVMPTHGLGDIEYGGLQALVVQIMDSENAPVFPAHLLARNADASYEVWYRFQDTNERLIELPPGGMPVFVVVHDAKVSAPRVDSSLLEKAIAQSKPFTIKLE
jgi:hypothetical protein